MTDQERVKKAFSRLSKAKQQKLLSSFQEFSAWIQKKFKDMHGLLSDTLKSIWEWLKEILFGPSFPTSPFPPRFPIPPSRLPWPWE